MLLSDYSTRVWFHCTEEHDDERCFHPELCDVQISPGQVVSSRATC